jgi:hypothetical protein
MEVNKIDGYGEGEAAGKRTRKSVLYTGAIMGSVRESGGNRRRKKEEISVSIG